MNRSRLTIDKKRRDKRNLDLIANFVDGYAAGWFFAVGECFKDALDIKYTERIEHTKAVMRWTQGNCYSFAEGHVLYDTPKAYLPWREALNHIGVICSVIRAHVGKIDIDGYFIPGSVTFTLSKPNLAKDGIETIDQYHLNQTDFVQYLKTGSMKTAIDRQEIGGDKTVNDPISHELVIHYRDSQGDTTERGISNISLEGTDKINAYCHLRNGPRTFWISNIISVIDPATGNIDKNTRKYFNVPSGSANVITPSEDPITSSVQALKMFSMLIRGFSKKERNRIVDFISEYGGVKESGKDMIDEWLQKLWCGRVNYDERIYVYEYEKGHDFRCMKPLIEAIPDEFMERCRAVALGIARGSGRRPIPSDLVNWIYENFSPSEEKSGNKGQRHIYVIKKE